jgi:hypothetical protein
MKKNYHTDLTKNKAKFAAFKKHKMEESFASNNNTQSSLKRYKKLFEAKVCSRGHGKEHGRGQGRGHKSFSVLSFQINE